MTVAIGLVCTDGVIVAADSMSSDGMVAMQGRKVHALNNFPLVWTASGAVYVIEEVEGALEKMETNPQAQLAAAFTTPNTSNLRTHVDTYVKRAMKAAYESALPYGLQQANQQGRHAFFTSFLLLGYANNQPWFLEIDGDGQMNWHHNVHKFYATGSGGSFAAVARLLMAHHAEGGDIDVNVGKMIAYRTIESTCMASSSGVGLPVQMAIATADECRVLTTDEIDEIGTAVDRWRQVERETLLNLMVGPAKDAKPDADAAEQIPTLNENGA